KSATNGVTWMSYQEGINAGTGGCPIARSGFYHPKHNPFVFFQDVSGNPPSQNNLYCMAHHKDLAALSGDLKIVAVASYNFITPNLCHDMHGDHGCPKKHPILAGDEWLASNLPAMISFVNEHDGVIFITWDEGSETQKMPFLAIGPHVKTGHQSGVR